MAASNARAYFDWNATAPLHPAAHDAMQEHLDAAIEVGHNPSSQHAAGRSARALLEFARATIAESVGAEPSSVAFTSGATEAINWAILAGARGGWDHLFVSEIEHDCAIAAARLRRRAGITWLPATRDGVIDLAAAERLLSQARIDAPDARRLVVGMVANNETGALQPVRELARLAHQHGAMMLADAAQAFGKIPFDFTAFGADLAVISSHKIGGPSGMGALLVREGLDMAPIFAGGGQEQGRRPGTENLLGVIGFSAAAAAIDTDAWTALAPLRARFETRLKNSLKDLVFCANGVHRLPNTSCFATPGWRAETQLMRLDLAGFAVSAGSACSSGKMATSHVLHAMGFDDGLASSAIRVSFGPGVEEAELDALASAWLDMHAARGA